MMSELNGMHPTPFEEVWRDERPLSISSLRIAIQSLCAGTLSSDGRASDRRGPASLAGDPATAVRTAQVVVHVINSSSGVQIDGVSTTRNGTAYGVAFVFDLTRS